MQEIILLLACFSAFFLNGRALEIKRLCEYNDVVSSAKSMVCRGMTSEVDMDAEMKAIKNSNIEELTIESSNFRFFIHDTFKGTKLKIINIKKCSIMELTDTHQGFEGLEDQLEELNVEDTSFVSHWDWNHLRNLRKLKKLIVRNSDMIYISDTLENVSKDTLEFVDFSENGIAWIHERAFAELKALKHLLLDKNEISALKRSMFPRIASNFLGLSIRMNLLTSLPTDIFSNMPKLNEILLSGNTLRTIDERIFGGVWGQLSTFSLNEAPVSCDCRMKWTLQRSKIPLVLVVRCHSPRELKGKYLLTLKPDDLWC